MECSKRIKNDLRFYFSNIDIQVSIQNQNQCKEMKKKCMIFLIDFLRKIAYNQNVYIFSQPNFTKIIKVYDKSYVFNT